MIVKNNDLKNISDLKLFNERSIGKYGKYFFELTNDERKTIICELKKSA